MLAFSINYPAVLISAVLMMVLGALWYGPLFAKPWMAAMGKSMEEVPAMGGNMAQTYGITFIGALLESFILGVLIASTGTDTLMGGIMLSVLVWLGFVATTGLNGVTFEGRPPALYFINNGYHLVALVIIGAVQGALHCTGGRLCPNLNPNKVSSTRAGPSVKSGPRRLPPGCALARSMSMSARSTSSARTACCDAPSRMTAFRR